MQSRWKPTLHYEQGNHDGKDITSLYGLPPETKLKRGHEGRGPTESCFLHLLQEIFQGLFPGARLHGAMWPNGLFFYSYKSRGGNAGMC